MKKILLLALFICSILLLSCGESGQKKHKSPKISPPDEFSVVFYNCENFFDTIDNSNQNDDAYVPASKTKWNSKKYNKKVRNISRVIRAINDYNFPALVGLSEIENQNVLTDLIHSESLAGAGYQIVYHENNSPRHADVALLIDPKRIKVVSSHGILVDESENAQREILYTKVVVMNTDTLHVFVNHWKSRNGEVKKTEAKRMPFATLLRKEVDSLFSKNANANILIMGDLNDEPNNKTISDVLNAGPIVNNLQVKTLYNLFYQAFDSGQGTVFHKKWFLFDQMIVSSNLLLPKENHLHFKSGSAKIFSKKWMLNNTTQGNIPYGTFDNEKYTGGFSDHLPVTIVLKMKR
ncbi:MAG: hypothetical protein WCQ95_04580 [Bacteroidota bacterium]